MGEQDLFLDDYFFDGVEIEHTIDEYNCFQMVPSQKTFIETCYDCGLTSGVDIFISI